MAELRRTGTLDTTPLDGKVPAKTFEQTFLSAAREARDSDTPAFLSALDGAAQALAHESGLRLRRPKAAQCLLHLGLIGGELERGLRPEVV